MNKIIKHDKTQTLRETNPYLKDKVKYKKALIQSVISSSKIEGIFISAEELAKTEIFN